MLKPFAELYALDISGEVSQKPVKKKMEDGSWREICKLDYLSWATVLRLLHEHGAETVRYGNILSAEGHSLHLLSGHLPEVHVWVEIDGARYEITYPVIDGSKDVKMDYIAQSDVHNASQRAFVKCVAVNTGLGLRLWEKEDKEQPKEVKDDINAHNVLRVYDRLNEKFSRAVRKIGSEREVCALLELNQKQMRVMFQCLQVAHDVEQKIDAL